MNPIEINKYPPGPIDFTAVFESMPGLCMLLDIDAPKFSILAVTKDYLVETEKTKEELIGHGIFEVYPPNPEEAYFTGKNKLAASFLSVIENKLVSEINLNRYDVQDKNGSYSEHYWKAINKPVINNEGAVVHIIHTAENITAAIKASEEEEKTKGMELAYNLLSQTPEAIAIVKGQDLIIEMANDPIIKVWGKGAHIIGKSLKEILPELESQGFFNLMHNVRESAVPYYAYEMPVTLVRGGIAELCYFNFTYQPYYETHKTIPVGTLIFATEVSEKVSAKKGLAESESRLNQLINSLPLVVWTAAPDGSLTSISNQWQEVFGNSVEESLGYGWISFVHPDDVESASKKWSKVLRSGELYETEFRARHKDGMYHWLLVRAVPIKNNKGKIISWYGTNTDIQDKKLVSDALKESEQRVLSILESAPFPIAVYTGKEMQIQLANQTILNTWGKGNEVLGKLFSEVVPELDKEIFQQLEAVYNTGMAFYAKNSRVDLLIEGKMLPHYFNYSFTPLLDSYGKVYGVMNTAANVTDLELARQEIEESERNLHNTIIQAPVAMCIFKGRNYKVEIANERMLEIWGITADAVLLKPIFEALPEAKGQGLEKLLDKVYTTGETFTANGLPVNLPRNGGIEIRYLNFVYEAFREMDQTISGIMAVAVDVTEQVIARNEIEKSEIQFRNLAQALPQLIWVTDAKGNSEFASNSWEDFTGIKPAGAKEWEAIVHPDDLENINNIWMHCLATGDIYKAEVRLKSKSGEYAWHAVHGEPVMNNENAITKWVGAFTEIHHIKVEQQRKDDFIKIVSHELKTPVTSIKGYVQLLLTMMNKENETAFPQPFKSSLVRIDAQIIKLTRLIAEMLDLSRIESNNLGLKMETFSINELVVEVVEDIVNTHSKPTINLQQEIQCQVWADRDRIGQVIINFITNGIKYSPQTNQVDIRIFASAQNQVGIAIKDYGIGIEKSQHHKIFERFYRVNGKSEQTYPGFGIGLYIANSIIQRHNGHIEVESEKGKGSEFTFFLNTSH
jgi:PAS domain S-box-containing protein